MAYADDMAQIQRRRMLAQALIQQGAQPQGQQAGRFFVAPNALSTLSSLGSIAGGALLDRRGAKQEKAATDAERKRLADALRGLSGPASAPEASPPDPRREAALSVLNGLPVDQMQGVVGQQAAANLFPKPKELKNVDLGNEIGFADESGNVVRRVAKGATPQGQTDDQREHAAAVKQGYTGSLEDWILQGKRAGATTVSTNVNTEKNLYGTMADKQGQANVELYSQAQKAPDLLQRARRVKDLVGPDSQAITGAGAEWLLAGAKIANQFGFNTGDAAADTEALSRDLAASTLDQIKSSGLGAGSGFSNADRDFLEKVVGGKITLEGKTLQRLAELNERSALATIQKWNATASRLDPKQLKTLGMSTIDMPAGTPAAGAKPKLSKNPDGSYDYVP